MECCNLQSTQSKLTLQNVAFLMPTCLRFPILESYSEQPTLMDGKSKFHNTNLSNEQEIRFFTVYTSAVDTTQFSTSRNALNWT